MSLGLIMTWVSMYFNSEFQYKTRSPFFQSAWKRRKYPLVAARASRRSIRVPRYHSPPMDPIHQTCPSNNFAPTEPFTTIPIALDSLLKYLSNDISYVQIRPGDAEKEHVNKEIGNSPFSFPRSDMRIRKTPLES